MFSVSIDWNPKQATLKNLLSKPECFDEAIKTALDLHGIVHPAAVSGSGSPTYFDELWSGLTRDAFISMPTVKDATIAWNIWHITRIEDLTANILMTGGNQVLNEKWLTKLSVTVTDTGNAMTDDEIIELSRSLNMEELRDYRIAVGLRTREILQSLKLSDIKRKVSADGIAKILAQGGVTQHPDSIWLLDFWSKKDIAGIIRMPITRHQIMHLTDSMRLKKRLKK